MMQPSDEKSIELRQRPPKQPSDEDDDIPAEEQLSHRQSMKQIDVQRLDSTPQADIEDEQLN